MQTWVYIFAAGACVERVWNRLTKITVAQAKNVGMYADGGASFARLQVPRRRPHPQLLGLPAEPHAARLTALRCHGWARWALARTRDVSLAEARRRANAARDAASEGNDPSKPNAGVAPASNTPKAIATPFDMDCNVEPKRSKRF